MIWWPVVLILLVAPFATYGYGWLDKQRLLVSHGRAIEAARKAAYADGHRHGVAEVRAEGVREVEKTREVIREVERIVEVPPPTPAGIIELCARSASCRERRGLK